MSELEWYSRVSLMKPVPSTGADLEAWLAVEPASRPARESLERLKKTMVERDEKLKVGGFL